MIKLKTALPEKLSDLILLALDDLRKCEKSKEFRIDMGAWVSTDGDGICHVCFAGACMIAHAPDLNRSFCRPLDFSVKNAQKFCALNSVRVGCICGALNVIGKKLPESLPVSIFVPRYHDDRTGWYRAMRKIAKLLQQEGL